MRVKAYIPGTDNVLTGEYTSWGNGEGGYLTVYDGAGMVVNTWSLLTAKGWVVEPILELPTKRDALVRYTDGAGFENTAWRSEADSFHPWQDGGGSFDDATLLDEIKLNSDGKFTVIFEGLDD